MNWFHKTHACMIVVAHEHTLYDDMDKTNPMYSIALAKACHEMLTFSFDLHHFQKRLPSLGSWLRMSQDQVPGWHVGVESPRSWEVRIHQKLV